MKQLKIKLFKIIYICSLLILNLKVHSILIFEPGGYAELIKNFYSLYNSSKDSSSVDLVKKNVDQMLAILKRIEENAIKDVNSNMPLRVYLKEQGFLTESKEEKDIAKSISEQIRSKVRDLHNLLEKVSKQTKDEKDNKGKKEKERVLIFEENGYKNKLERYEKLHEEIDHAIKDNQIDIAQKKLNEIEEILKFIQKFGTTDLINNIPLRAFFAAHNFYPPDIYAEENVAKEFQDIIGKKLSDLKEKKDKVEQMMGKEEEPPIAKATAKDLEDLKKKVIALPASSEKQELMNLLNPLSIGIESFQERFEMLRKAYNRFNKSGKLPPFEGIIYRGIIKDYKNKFLSKEPKKKEEEPRKKELKDLLSKIQKRYFNL